MTSRSVRAATVLCTVVVSSTMGFAAAAPRAQQVSQARPRSGKWVFADTNGTIKSATTSVTKGGKKVEKISVRPVSASGCASHHDVIPGKYAITKGGDPGDTWHVGDTHTVDGRIPVKIHQGSKRIAGFLYVDFTSPKAGRVEVVIGKTGATKCDLYFGISAPKH